MKNIFWVPIFLIGFSSPFAKRKGTVKVFNQDSTLHQRFIMHVLSEYELEGRWIFVRVDSVYQLPNNYELIHPVTIYGAYSESFLEMNKERFIFNAYETLRQHELFERYPNKKHPIKGVKVDMDAFNRLKAISVKKLLRTYFNRDRSFKSKYKSILYEIIAICYSNNIQVVTPTAGLPYYVTFK